MQDEPMPEIQQLTRNEIIAALPDMTGKNPVSPKLDVIAGVLSPDLQMEHTTLMAHGLRVKASFEAMNQCKRIVRKLHHSRGKSSKGQKEIEPQASCESEVKRLTKEYEEAEQDFDVLLDVFVEKVLDAFPSIDSEFPLIIREGTQVGHSNLLQCEFISLLKWC